MIRFFHAAALMYVDPAGTSILMQILAPLFVLVSVLAGHFRKRVAAIFRRPGRRSEEGH
jgi:hypothetical protein